MKPVKTHTFNGTKYEIEIDDTILHGQCEGTRITKNPRLSIYTGLKGVKALETCIHEALHACCFAKSEKIVDRTARDIARFLWRVGYRHGTDGKGKKLV